MTATIKDITKSKESLTKTDFLSNPKEFALGKGEAPKC